jgi:phosphoglycerate dehydrogenase-like enzyme
MTGRIYAILDVTDPEPLNRGDPLYNLPNVQLTPHIAGSLGTELHRMTSYALDEIENFVQGAPARYSVRREDLSRMA